MQHGVEVGAKQGFAGIDALVQRRPSADVVHHGKRSTMNRTAFTTANELEIRVGRVSRPRVR